MLKVKLKLPTLTSAKIFLVCLTHLAAANCFINKVSPEMPSSNANFLVIIVAFLLVEGGQYELERELNILSKSSSSWSILKCD